MTMEELKERALRIVQNKKYPVRYAGGNITKSWQITTSVTNKHRFSVMNGICGFWEKNILYVLPFSPDVQKTLLDNGFAPESFYVPFSHGEIPLWAETKWKKMLQ